MAEFKKAQVIVGINEGGYQDDPQDSGNYYKGRLIGTNWGISAPVLAEYLGRIPTKLEMQNLSKKVAIEILRIRFWSKNHLGSLKNQSVANLIYDGVVNHGIGGMRNLIDIAIKSVGGKINYYEIFTPKGIRYINSLNQKSTFNAIKRVRASKYKRSKKKRFIKGWLNRLNRIKYYANNTISAVWPYVAGMMGVIGIILIVL